MDQNELTRQIIFDSGDPLKIRNISLGCDFEGLKSLETLPGFATPFMSLHEDFSQTPFDIRFRYHNQNQKVAKIVVDVAQFLQKNPNTEVLDATFEALGSFYKQHFGEQTIHQDPGNYEDAIRHKWTAGEKGNMAIYLDLGFEKNGAKDDDKIKVLKLSIQYL